MTINCKHCDRPIHPRTISDEDRGPADLFVHENNSVFCTPDRYSTVAQPADLVEALEYIATARQDADEWDQPDFDWRLIATKQENAARRALGLPEWR